ncbi:hypothetical protein BU17DRAFT_90819 [Hysterangium stoloniferum]|nr:hypothetical protein BU17DRAFT_90819 [Hysterangium stoloniferum]
MDVGVPIADSFDEPTTMSEKAKGKMIAIISEAEPFTLELPPSSTLSIPKVVTAPTSWMHVSINYPSMQFMVGRLTAVTPAEYIKPISLSFKQGKRLMGVGSPPYAGLRNHHTAKHVNWGQAILQLGGSSQDASGGVPGILQELL